MLHPTLQQCLTFHPELSKPSSNVWLVSESIVIISHGEHVYYLNPYTMLNQSKKNQRKKNMPRKTLMTLFPVMDESQHNFHHSQPIWKTIDIFQQNNQKIHKQVTRYVMEQLDVRNDDCFALNTTDTPTTLYGIGGEFYRYFVMNRHQYNLFIGFSNNQTILDVARYNLSLYGLNYKTTLLNYNTCTFLNMTTCIVNLSVLPVNLLMQLRNTDKLIIITCNQKVYNQRRHIIERTHRLCNFAHITDTDINPNICVSVYVLIRLNSVKA